MSKLVRDILRASLRKFLTPDEGDEIRQALHRIALQTYKPKREPQAYMDFMEWNECSFEVCHPQSENHPWYMEMFSVASQHVQGDCLAECLDKAMDIAEHET